MSLFYESGYVNNVIILNNDFVYPILYDNANIIGFNNNVIYSSGNTSYLVFDLKNIHSFAKKYGYTANVINGNITGGDLFRDSSDNFFTINFFNESNVNQNTFNFINSNELNTLTFGNIIVNNGIDELGYKNGNILIDCEHFFPQNQRNNDWTFTFKIDLSYTSKPNIFDLSLNVNGQMLNSVLNENNLVDNLTKTSFDLQFVIGNSNIDTYIDNKLTNNFQNYVFNSNIIEIISNIEYSQSNNTKTIISDVKFFKGTLNSIRHEKSNDESNLFIGKSSGYNNNSGYNNSFLGSYSGFNNKNGHDNILFGNNSGKNMIDAKYNIFLGHNTGRTCNTDYNIYIGSNVGYWNEKGYNNTILGNDGLNPSFDYISNIRIDSNINNDMILFPISYIFTNKVQNISNINFNFTYPEYKCDVKSNVLYYNSNIILEVYFSYDQLYSINNFSINSLHDNISYTIFNTLDIFSNISYDIDNDLYKLNVIDYITYSIIYISEGDTSEPFYNFSTSLDGTIYPISQLTLKYNTKYTFQRLNNAITHPFYVSDQGHNMQSNNLIITGDGTYNNGIIGTQSFSFMIPNNVSQIYGYCSSHSTMVHIFNVL